MKRTFYVLAALVNISLWGQYDNSPANSDFQMGFQYWDYKTQEASNTDSKPRFFMDITSEGHNDNRSLKVNAVSPTKTKGAFETFIQAEIPPLKKGKKYRLEFWVKTSMEDQFIAYQLYSDQQEFSRFWEQNRIVLEKDSWEKITKEFIAEGNKTKLNSPKLRFGFSYSKGVLLVDDITLKRI